MDFEHALVEAIRKRPCTTRELAHALQVPVPTIEQALLTLQQRGIVASRKRETTPE